MPRAKVHNILGVRMRQPREATGKGGEPPPQRPEGGGGGPATPQYLVSGSHPAATLLPDGKAPMVPLMRILFC